MTNVFVYGTLKKGFSLHNFLSESVLICEDSITGTMYDLGPYPSIILEGGKVHGEVYEITPKTLKILDTVEGYPSHYKRTEVTTDKGLKVLVYYYQSKKYLNDRNVVKSGIYFNEADKK